MQKPVQLILLGAPGSGKGTQSILLADDANFKHISTGDLLRSEIAKKTALGGRVTEIMDAGGLVDDSIVLELLKRNCDTSKTSYIFDGFPRNIAQAEMLDKELLNNSNKKVFYFDISLQTLAQRITNRRSCASCGEIYNLISRPPKKQGTCDNCGSKELKQRKDDNEASVNNRLEIFKKTIDPMLDYYRKQGNLIHLDASNDAEFVFNQIKKNI